MGISTGGMTLLHMATAQPERVEAMVLIGATSYFPEQAREFMSDPESLSVEAFEASGQAHSRGAEQARELASQFFAFKDNYDDMNFTAPYLSTITASTLIVHGDRDQFFPVSIPVEEYEAIPDSYLWIVPNGGHGAALESERGRTMFSELVLDFLAGEWR
jgi:pimeloyl-ACP methyl ester carboxylesterase